MILLANPSLEIRIDKFKAIQQIISYGREAGYRNKTVRLLEDKDFK